MTKPRPLIGIRAELPYRDIPDVLMAKTQADVLAADKRTVCAALGGDDGILTFVIQSAFFRTAKFIRDHGYNLYDPVNYAAIVAFVRTGVDPTAAPASDGLRNGADSRPIGHTAPRDDARADKGGQPTAASTQSRTADRRQSDQGREQRGEQKTSGKQGRRAAGGC